MAKILLVALWCLRLIGHVSSTSTSTTPAARQLSTTPTACEDSPQDNCWNRPDEDCFGIYEPWARAHCPVRCGFCPDKQPPCVDVNEYCSQYGVDACLKESFQGWARTNCRKHCNLCSVPSRPEAIPGFYGSSPHNGDVFYACAGDSVYIPWKYILDVGEELGDTQWYFNDHMVAVLSHGIFLTTPVGQNKSLEYRVNAGIVLSHVQVEDSGNYSVEIHVYRNGQSFTFLTRFVQLLVNADLQTVGHQLHVSQNPEAVFDPAASAWALQLRCGTFTFWPARPPPFQVEWVTPSREVVASTDFRDNHFNLLLKNPVRGGTYTCRIPARHVTAACLFGRNGTSSSFQVDQIDGRFALLDKENQRLRDEVQSLQQVVNSFNSIFQQRVISLERQAQPVAFYATSANVSGLTGGASLVPTDVSFNYANGYNPTSGAFSAPLPGLYQFFGTCAPVSDGSVYCLCGLYLDGTLIIQGGAETLATGSDLGTYKGSIGGSAQGLLRLTSSAQSVSLRVESCENVTSSHVTFSGFLVNFIP